MANPVSINMADTGTEDRVQKMEVDYSSTVDEKVPKCEKLAKVNQFQKINIDFFNLPGLITKLLHSHKKVFGHSYAFMSGWGNAFFSLCHYLY